MRSQFAIAALACAGVLGFSAVALAERPSTNVIKAVVIDCGIKYGEYYRSLEILPRGDGALAPSFHEPSVRDGLGGEVRGDQASTSGDRRRFTLVFKNGLEVDYELNADGRLTARAARQNNRSIAALHHGSCKVVR